MIRLASNRYFAWSVIAGAVLLLSTVIVGVAWPVRGALHEQVLRREAAALEAVVEVQRETGTRAVRDLGEEIAAFDVFYALLESPRLDGLVAVQLFEGDGQVALVVPDAAFVEELPAGQRVVTPQAVFHPHTATATGLGFAVSAGEGPWLEVVIPVQIGADSPVWARYWMDGRPVAAELAEVDARLWWQAGISALAGSLVLALGLGWALGQLRRQQEDLAQANRELLLNSKTAAIGAISAHLMHGLKNPLAGIEGFIAEGELAQADAANTGEAWREAAETTRRVRRMVNEVMAVLQDQSVGADYTVPIGEVVDQCIAKARPAAVAAGVELSVATATESCTVSGRAAALVGLALDNLLDNAITAAGAAGGVTLDITPKGGQASIRISDTGPGLPAAVKAAGFAPVTSSKTGGAGVGLALGHALLGHAGGELTLAFTGTAGTIFELNVPLTAREERGVETS